MFAARTPAVAIFLLAFVIRVALVFVLRYYRNDLDLDSEIAHIAAQFAKDFTFANPYLCPTGATAHAAPGFTMILGSIYRLFQPGPLREIVTCLLGSAVSSAVYALLPWLAVSLGFNRVAGVWAAVFGALVPLFFWIEARGIWDAPYVCLFLVLCVAATLGLNPGAPRRRIVAAGIAWGVAFWFAPSLLPVFLLCAAVLFYRSLPVPRALGVVLALAVPALAIASPWMVRNYAQFHTLFWMRDNFGLELHTSNHAGAWPMEVDNRERTGPFQIHPNSNAQACAVVQRVGEIAYFKQQQREAVEWIGSHPGDFAKLTAARSIYFWFLPLNSMPRRLLLAALTALCFIGIALLWRTRAARMLGLILVAYSAIYYLVQVDPRFRYPLHPPMLVGAAAAVCFVVRKTRERYHRESRPVSSLC